MQLSVMRQEKTSQLVPPTQALGRVGGVAHREHSEEEGLPRGKAGTGAGSAARLARARLLVSGT